MAFAGAALHLPRPSGRAKVPLLVTPLVAAPSPAYAFLPKMLVRVLDPAIAALSPLTRPLFRLTEREWELAALLVAGHSLESAASAMRISRNTARVHLQSVFAKTQTSRQMDLVRVLMTASAPQG